MSKAKETIFFKTVEFKFEPSYDERESIIRRAVYVEQDKHKSLRWIIAEKDMTKARIKFFAKGSK